MIGVLAIAMIQKHEKPTNLCSGELFSELIGSLKCEIDSNHSTNNRRRLMIILDGILYRVSLLQPENPKFQEFADQVKERAQTHYNYTFSESEEVSSK